MRSMAVRPRIFSRLRCWAGRELVVEDDGVGVEGQSTARAAPRPCPGPTKVAGSGAVAALHDPAHHVGTGACRPAAPARRGRRRPSSGDVHGEHHPHEHDALPEAALDERHGRVATSVAARSGPPTRPSTRTSSTSASTVTVPTSWVGPPRNDVGARRARRRGCRPGCARAPAGRTAPWAWAAAATAHVPVPQARVSPTPRSHTRRVSSSGRRPGPHELHVGPADDRPLQTGPDARAPRRRTRVRPEQHEVRIAHVDTPGPARRDSGGSASSSPRRARAHVHAPVARPRASGPGRYSHRAQPAQGGARSTVPGADQPGVRPRPGPGSGSRCRSSRPRPRRRCAGPWSAPPRPRPGDGPDHAVGADAPVAVAQGARLGRRQRAAVVGVEERPGSRCRPRGAWSVRSAPRLSIALSFSHPVPAPTALSQQRHELPEQIAARDRAT